MAQTLPISIEEFVNAYLELDFLINRLDIAMDLLLRYDGQSAETHLSTEEAYQFSEDYEELLLRAIHRWRPDTVFLKDYQYQERRWRARYLAPKEMPAINAVVRFAMMIQSAPAHCLHQDDMSSLTVEKALSLSQKDIVRHARELTRLLAPTGCFFGLGGRMDLFPKGQNVDAMFDDYTETREKIEASYHCLAGFWIRPSTEAPLLAWPSVSKPEPFYTRVEVIELLAKCCKSVSEPAAAQRVGRAINKYGKLKVYADSNGKEVVRREDAWRFIQSQKGYNSELDPRKESTQDPDFDL